MCYSFLTRKNIDGKDFYIKNFSDGSKLIMTGVDFDFRKFNLKNTNKFLRRFLGEERKIAKTVQRHTKNVVYMPKPGEYFKVDGFITNNNPIMIVTADCIPILIKGKNNTALVHSGWRGVEKRIYFETINKMNEDKTDLKFYLLPSISRDSFQVGEDFLAKFKNRYNFDRFKTKDVVEGKYLYDLKGFVKYELNRFGVDLKNIFIEDTDTLTSPCFHSYRAEGKNYGLNAIIYIPKSL